MIAQKHRFGAMFHEVRQVLEQNGSTTRQHPDDQAQGQDHPSLIHVTDGFPQTLLYVVGSSHLYCECTGKRDTGQKKNANVGENL